MSQDPDKPVRTKEQYDRKEGGDYTTLFREGGGDSSPSTSSNTSRAQTATTASRSSTGTSRSSTSVTPGPVQIARDVAPLVGSATPNPRSQAADTTAFNTRGSSVGSVKPAIKEDRAPFARDPSSSSGGR